MRKPHVTAVERRLITERAQYRCEYCQSPLEYSTEPFAIEHIIPVSRGGATSLDNLALACSGCNGSKYNKVSAPDPVDASSATIFNPRQQTWHEHFGWSEDYTIVVGLTPTGRATVEALQLNRPGVVNLRILLLLVRKHPPSSIN